MYFVICTNQLPFFFTFYSTCNRKIIYRAFEEKNISSRIVNKVYYEKIICNKLMWYNVKLHYFLLLLQFVIFLPLDHNIVMFFKRHFQKLQFLFQHYSLNLLLIFIFTLLSLTNFSFYSVFSIYYQFCFTSLLI